MVVPPPTVVVEATTVVVSVETAVLATVVVVSLGAVAVLVTAVVELKELCVVVSVDADALVVTTVLEPPATGVDVLACPGANSTLPFSALGTTTEPRSAHPARDEVTTAKASKDANASVNLSKRKTK